MSSNTATTFVATDAAAYDGIDCGSRHNLVWSHNRRRTSDERSAR